ncbi:hypothetical protein ACFWNN_20620 [Lentzea sp. NPDC058450]|uniref:hypothetical protein n=1 Tax=Lentzea sp. NPDC058450 TaxID=3346505 RepID=UPI00365F262D
MNLRTVAALTAALLVTPAVAVAAPATHQPAVIDAKGPGVFPHSADYDGRSRTFLVGSLSTGTVSVVSRDGQVRTLVDDPRLTSTQGIRVDLARNRVLVTDVDLGTAKKSTPESRLKTAGVASYDLRTGKRQWYADLAALSGGNHLIADVVVDCDGTAYAVDTQSANLYRIDRRGKASVLLTSPLLAGNPNLDVPGFLDDIAASSVTLVSGNQLIVSKGDGSLVRVPLRRPEQASAVQLNTNLVALTASVRTLPDGSIAAVSSGLLTGTAAVVQRVRPNRDWTAASVTVTDQVADPITSGITEGPRGAVYTVSGGLLDLLQGRPNAGFTLREVRIG